MLGHKRLNLWSLSGLAIADIKRGLENRGRATEVQGLHSDSAVVQTFILSCLTGEFDFSSLLIFKHKPFNRTKI